MKKISTIDELTSTFKKGELIVLAARPTVGNYAFAVNLAVSSSIKRGVPTGFFSLDTSAESILQRIITMETKIDSEKIISGFLDESELGLVTDATARIYESPLYIDDAYNITFLELRTQVRRMKAKHDIQIIFINYLELIIPENKAMPSHEQISELSKSLKSLVRELDITVVVFSQLGHQSDGTAPGLADLRESKAIGQDADMVMFLHRERKNYYEENALYSIETDLIISKQSNGSLGVIKMALNPYNMNYELLGVSK